MQKTKDLFSHKKTTWRSAVLTALQKWWWSRSSLLMNQAHLWY